MDDQFYFSEAQIERCHFDLDRPMRPRPRLGRFNPG